MHIKMICESLKERAIKIQETDQEFWDNIPLSPICPENMNFEEQCWWAVKQYTISDQKIRDLPYSPILKGERS